MRTLMMLLCPLLCCGSLHAEFREWTNTEQQKVSMELVSVTEENGEKVGEFLLPGGNKARVKASSLIESDAELLKKWRAPWGGSGPASAFDKHFEYSLLKVVGEEVRPVETFTKPQKYYLFYYTSVSCGYCQKFTPELVEFYNKNKSEQFELVTISLDKLESHMKNNAISKKVPWPMLQLDKVAAFRRQFDYPCRAIPMLALCDLEGNLIKGSQQEGQDRKTVLDHLTTLLQK